MNQFVTLLAGVVLGWAAASPGWADDVTGLYEAEVPVTGQGSAERTAASRAALAEVLVKVSGREDAVQQPALKPMLDQAEQWVQRYQYRAITHQAPVSAMTDVPPPAQVLWVAFDRETINQRLSEATLPIWGANRPRTLLWLAMEEGSERFLVGGDSGTDLQPMILTHARQRGLPLTLPLMDLQDQSAVTVADVWGDFADAIAKASERYQPEAILVGRVYAAGPDKWQGRWTLYHRGGMTAWESAPALQEEVIAAGLNGAAEQFARRYAITLTPDVAGNVVLTVANVNSLTDYARALKYLQSLDAVAGVQVARVDGTAVSYRLKVRGQAEDLVRAIGWGKTLVPADTEVAGEEDSGGHHYLYRMVP